MILAAALMNTFLPEGIVVEVEDWIVTGSPNFDSKESPPNYNAVDHLVSRARYPIVDE